MRFVKIAPFISKKFAFTPLNLILINLKQINIFSLYMINADKTTNYTIQCNNLLMDRCLQKAIARA